MMGEVSSSSEDDRISAEFHDEVAGPEPWPKESRARAIRKQCQLISGEEELSGHQHTRMKMGTLMSKMKMTKRMREWTRRVMI